MLFQLKMHIGSCGKSHGVRRILLGSCRGNIMDLKGLEFSYDLSLSNVFLLMQKEQEEGLVLELLAKFVVIVMKLFFTFFEIAKLQCIFGLS